MLITRAVISCPGQGAGQLWVAISPPGLLVRMLHPGSWTLGRSPHVCLACRPPQACVGPCKKKMKVSHSLQPAWRISKSLHQGCHLQLQASKRLDCLCSAGP